MLSPLRSRVVGCATAFALSLVGVVGAAPTSTSSLHALVADSGEIVANRGDRGDRGAVAASRSTLPAAVRAAVDDSLRGASGRLYVHFLQRETRDPGAAIFTRVFGSAALRTPGVYTLDDSALAHPFAFITLRPFADKARDGTLGPYRIGFWPGERGRVHSAAYANPTGFIEVTRDNVELPVSAHFRLGEFLTHGQSGVWPTYLVLHEDLVDKLELVIAELEHEGIPVRHMTIMSGFRTPDYNASGGATSGRSTVSRHMYGDASDVFVDNDGDGRMDDLNHDGRVDSRDSRVIVEAAGRVERAHPELVGGEGVYAGTSSHGPFAHIDVRGTRARW